VIELSLYFCRQGKRFHERGAVLGPKPIRVVSRDGSRWRWEALIFSLSAFGHFYLVLLVLGLELGVNFRRYGEVLLLRFRGKSNFDQFL
jgi:hypothetical protein